MKEYEAKLIVGIGDTHSLNTLYRCIISAAIDDAIVIGMGDHGEGDEYIPQSYFILNRLNQHCIKHNIRVFLVRGNHSNPAYFKNDSWVNKAFSHIYFVPDYTYLKFNHKIFLFAGGAISVDRKKRIRNNEPFWKDEGFSLPENLQDLQPCDVLITHASGDTTFPFDSFSRIQFWLDQEPQLGADLMEERLKISQLYKQVQPKLNMFGHYHMSFFSEIEKTIYCCLSVQEMKDMTLYIEHL